MNDGTGAITFGTTNWNYVDLILGPATYSTRRDASTDVSGTTWGFGVIPGGWAYLGNQSVGGRVMSGDIAEVLIYANALTTTDRDAVVTYITTKYAL